MDSHKVGLTDGILAIAEGWDHSLQGKGLLYDKSALF